MVVQKFNRNRLWTVWPTKLKKDLRCIVFRLPSRLAETPECCNIEFQLDVLFAEKVRSYGKFVCKRK